MIDDDLNSTNEEEVRVRPIPKSLRHKISRFGLPCVDPVLIILFVPPRNDQSTGDGEKNSSR